MLVYQTNTWIDHALGPLTEAAYTSNTQLLRPSDEHEMRNCQLVYILGVEGVGHHGFEPIIKQLASIQIDTASNVPYDLVNEEWDKLDNFQFALYGEYNKSLARKRGGLLPMGFNHTPPLDDPLLIKELFARSCPSDGKKHLIIDWHSFPSGRLNAPPPFRVYRQNGWLDMPSEEIAKSKLALNHPFNLTAFYETYSKYADVKFVVLYRPYLETIASHADWDQTPVIHSEITRGFIYILRRFLDKYIVDARTGEKIWHLVCMQQINSKFHGNDEERLARDRRLVIEKLATFLKWPTKECPHCFDSWRESTKDYRAILGDSFMAIKQHSESLKGVWPPLTEGDLCDI